MDQINRMKTEQEKGNRYLMWGYLMPHLWASVVLSFCLILGQEKNFSLILTLCNGFVALALGVVISLKK